MLVLPLSVLRLGQNIFAQLASAVALICIFIIWVFTFCHHGLHYHVPVVGDNGSQLMGFVISNFAFVCPPATFSSAKQLIVRSQQFQPLPMSYHEKYRFIEPSGFLLFSVLLFILFSAFSVLRVIISIPRPIFLQRSVRPRKGWYYTFSLSLSTCFFPSPSLSPQSLCSVSSFDII